MDFGEFRYVNNIDVSMERMLEINCKCKEEYNINLKQDDVMINSLENELMGTLIPIGGRKRFLCDFRIIKKF